MRNLPIARLAIEKDAEKHTDTKVQTGYTSTFAEFGRSLKMNTTGLI